MKKTWIVSTLVVCALAAVLIYVGLRDRDASEKTSAGHTRVQTSVIHADFVRGYSSVGELAQMADVVVAGQVVEIAYVEHSNGETYTRVTLRVDKSYKGTVAERQLMTVLEVGGVTTQAVIKSTNQPDAEVDPSLANVKVVVTLEGAPLAKLNERVVYFAGPGELGLIPEQYYVPLGAFQGKFYLDSGTAERFMPEGMLSDKLNRMKTNLIEFQQDIVEAVERN